jgi:hypothetical protein
MPQDINIANNLISLGQQKDSEDHIVALINNHIVDFVFEPGQGVASQLPRNINYTQTNPLVIEYSKSLFNPNGLYGQYGYIDQNAKVEGDWITGNQITPDIPPFVRSNTITKPNQKT